MEFKIRKTVAVILCLIGSTAMAQSVVVDKSNLVNPTTYTGIETVVVGVNNSLLPSGQTIMGTNNTNTAYGASIFGNNNSNGTMNSVILGTENVMAGTLSDYDEKGFMIGINNEIKATNKDSVSILFGTGLSNNGNSDCIAFGSRYKTTGCDKSNQFSVGNSTVAHVSDAVEDSDAVNLGQLKGLLGSGGTTDLSGVQSQIDTHTGQITVIKNDISTTNNRVATVEIQTNKNTTEIATHTGQITNLQENANITNHNVAVLQLNTYENTQQISSLEYGLDQTNVQVRENTKNISNLDSRVGNLENRVNGVERMAKGYAFSAAAMGVAAAGITFDPRLERQFGMAAATVNGKQAVAMGVAIKKNNTIFNAKFVGSGSMKGVSIGASWAF